MIYNQPLFQPISLRSITADNRIVLPPMSQYSAEEGVANDWHLQYGGAHAAGGAGIVMMESTHVSDIGRLTAGCLGLWNDAQQEALARVAKMIVTCGSVPAIQIGHAGRKACTTIPWREKGKFTPEGRSISIEDGGWQPVGPSPIPFAEGMTVPHELSKAEIASIIGEFADSARRARQAGFKILEIHGAHGYLLHSFRSTFSNQRTDEYGGSTSARRRMLMETIDAVRGEWPDDLPLFVRLSCSEWADGGIDMADSIDLSTQLAARGDVDLIDCSSGGGTPLQRFPSIHPGYQVPFSEGVRNGANIATAALGMITEASHANEIIGNGRADLVMIGRAMLADPAWPLRAAKTLHAKIPLRGPYKLALIS